MFHRVPDRRQKTRRDFRPTLEGAPQLETRCLLSGGGKARALATFPADGGRAVVVSDFDGERYRITARDNNSTALNPVGTSGFFAGGVTISARPVRGGSWDIRVNGSTVATQILIEPIMHGRRAGQAHTFPTGSYNNDSMIHIRNIIVPTGRLNAVLGYRTASLDGSLIVAGTAAVDRIALFNIDPGASIVTGGDLNTFDVYNNLAISGGPSIKIGRDLNWWNVGGTVSITAGSTFDVGRDIGLVAQPAKGTDPGGKGGLIQGNLDVGLGSAFTVGRSLDATLLVQGSVSGASRITIPNGASNLVALGGFTP